jgi:hypothetical protein
MLRGSIVVVTWYSCGRIRKRRRNFPDVSYPGMRPGLPAMGLDSARELEDVGFVAGVGECVR